MPLPRIRNDRLFFFVIYEIVSCFWVALNIRYTRAIWKVVATVDFPKAKDRAPYVFHMGVKCYICKCKCLFGFQKISWFITKVTFASIPRNIEDLRMHIFLHLVDNLQTPKTRNSFLGIAVKVSQLSIPLSGSFRSQDLKKITKIQSPFFLWRLEKSTLANAVQIKKNGYLLFFAALLSAMVVAYRVGCVRISGMIHSCVYLYVSNAVRFEDIHYLICRCTYTVMQTIITDT